jgi:chromosome segregation ATPase
VCADVNAVFDERDEIRRAMRAGENLEALLTRPLDFENIDERISKCQAERDDVDTELARANTAANELPSVQEELTGLEATLEELRAERDALEPSSEDEALVEKRDELSDVRAEREQVETLVDQLEAAIERTREKLEQHHRDLQDLSIPDASDIEAEIAAVRAELTEKERDAEVLQAVYTANQQLLEEDRLHLLTDVESGLLDDRLTCWTCGSEAPGAEFEARLETLGERVMAYTEEARAQREQLEQLQDRRDELNRKRRQKTDLEHEIQNLESTLTDREESLASAERRLAELRDRAASLADSVEEMDDRLTELDSEIKYTTAQIEDLRDELSTLEARADQRELLAAEREELTAEIESLRSRKSALKERARRAFDDAISDVIDRFDTGFETARLTPEFDLVVARHGRATDITALSEGEVELLSVVTVLAAHDAYDVADRVPVMLLDGLGGLAEENLHTLVDYVGEVVPFLVFTAYPEHGPFDGHRIDTEDWEVVTAELEADAHA